MAEVGKKTGKQTQAGRDVYETPEGEMVSEKSTTIEYKGKWINVPTIHGGKQHSEDELIEMLDKGLIKPTSAHDKLEEAIQAAQSRSNSLEFNKGGTPMLEKQMELFEEGGLKDEGGMVDEESGNDVPNGSTKKEVRDDVPAMLSEGEFVLPADVVRYHGLEKIMQLRDEAKFGIKKMEAMGQMGNSDEATLDDDVPFGPADLIIVGSAPMEDEDKPREMAEGGMVHASQGTFVPSSGMMGYQPSVYEGQQTTASYTPPSSVTPPAPATSPAGGYLPKFVMNQTTPVDSGSLASDTDDKFFDTVEDVYTTKEYINPETGERKTISFYQGSPVVDIPEGFIAIEDYETESDDLESTSVETTQVTPSREDKSADKMRLSSMTKQQSSSAIASLKDASTESIIDAWNKNQQTKAMMTTLAFINPVVGMAGRAASSLFGNQLEDLMKSKNIPIPDQTTEKQSFLQKIGSSVKNMFSGEYSLLSDTPEAGTSYVPIYSPEDSPYGRSASKNLLTTTNTGGAFTSSQAEAYDNAVKSGNVDVAKHYEIINNRYNKMADYAAGKSTEGLSKYDKEQAAKLFDSEGNRVADTVNEANNNNDKGNNNTTSSEKNIVEKFFDGVAEAFGFGGDDE